MSFTQGEAGRCLHPVHAIIEKITVKFRIENVTCGHCVSTLSRAIQAIDPAAKVNEELGEKILSVSSSVAADELQRAIEAAG